MVPRAAAGGRRRGRTHATSRIARSRVKRNTLLGYQCRTFASFFTAWAEWSPWDTCSVTCDSGAQTRSRDCVHPDEGLTANDECEVVAGEDTSEEEQECNTEACPMPGYNATNDRKNILGHLLSENGT